MSLTEPRNLMTKTYAASDPRTKDGMDAAHEAHLTRILSEFNADARAKYEAGQEEHGGNLWEKPGMIEHALAEAIDLVVYLYTLRDQQRRSFVPTGRDT
jgi:hypothetical protein